MHLLQGIHPLLKVDVVGRELGLAIAVSSASRNAPKWEMSMNGGAANLVLSLAELLLGVLEGARSKGSNLASQVPRSVASLSASSRSFDGM